jgi:menaquinone-specific isochorismate synthase
MIRLPTLKRLKHQFKNRKSYTYTINEKKIVIEQTTLRLHIDDPEKWLESQELYPKIFWKGKDSKRLILALGSLLTYDSTPNIQIQKIKKGPRLFGGVPFLDSLLSKAKYSVWNSFSNYSFFLPEIEIILDEKGKGVLHLHSLKEEIKEKIFQRLESLCSSLVAIQEEPKQQIQRIDMPNFSSWCDTIEKSLHSFEKTCLEKVVLARASYLTYSSNLHPFHLLKDLKAFSLNATLFAYAPSSEGALIGVSPEMFFQRQENHIVTEAVAGTCKKTLSKNENTLLIKKLKQNSKEKQEFDYVSEFIKEKLKNICLEVKSTPSKSIKETATVFHLYESFNGFLKKGVTDLQIIKLLHPTPAMGGKPQVLAMEFLDQTEPFVRGQYAAPIGWMSPNSTEMIVAIRSAFVRKNCMTVFAGAGIVKGSNPVKEWEELELKISHFLKMDSLCKTA